MSHVLIVRDPIHAGVSERLRMDLVSREWSVSCQGPAVRLSQVPAGHAVVVLIPVEAHSRARIVSRIVEAQRAGRKILLLDYGPDSELPERVYRAGVDAHLSAIALSYDRLFEEVYEALLGPFPAWLSLRVRPSVMARPTGVAWWTEDLFVADEGNQHVARIGPVDANIVVPGLSDPHHVHIDRQTLIVANRSADEVLIASMENNTVREMEVLVRAHGSLRRPHALAHAHYVSALADTDNHRVMIGRGDLQHVQSSSYWKTITPKVGSFSGPCGVHVDAKRIWVADTFNHRLLAFNHDGVETLRLGAYGRAAGEFGYPVGIVTWRDQLFVADEESERLQMFVLRQSEEGGLSAELVTGNVAASWMGQPFGLAINRENRIAVADRRHKCVWLIDVSHQEFSRDIEMR